MSPDCVDGRGDLSCGKFILVAEKHQVYSTSSAQISLRIVHWTVLWIFLGRLVNDLLAPRLHVLYLVSLDHRVGFSLRSFLCPLVCFLMVSSLRCCREASVHVLSSREQLHPGDVEVLASVSLVWNLLKSVLHALPFLH